MTSESLVLDILSAWTGLGFVTMIAYLIWVDDPDAPRLESWVRTIIRATWIPIIACVVAVWAFVSVFVESMDGPLNKAVQHISREIR